MENERDRSEPVILCRTCAHYVLEKFKVAARWREDRRCVCGMRFAGRASLAATTNEDVASA